MQRFLGWGVEEFSLSNGNTVSDESRRERSPSHPEGFERWIESAVAYVPTVARRFLNSGLSFDELLAAGNLGLVQAALRFDPAREVKFVTYADWWIRKAIFKAIQEQSGPVRLPRYRLEQLRDLKDARSRLRHSKGRDPDASELAQATGRSAQEIDFLTNMDQRGLSIEQPASPHHDRSLGQVLADAPEKSPQDTLIRRDFLRHLRQLTRRLDPRERKVLRLRYGFGDRGAMTLREAAVVLGISRERVRQIERSALQNLRDLLL